MDQSLVNAMSGAHVGAKHIDRRSAVWRRYKATVAGLIDDLGREPTTTEMLLICRAAGLSVELERIEAGIEHKPELATTQTRLARALVIVLREINLAQRKSRGQARDHKRPTPDSHAKAILED